MLFLNSVRVAPGQRSAVAGAMVVLVGVVAGAGAAPLAWAQEAGGDMLTPVVVSATRVPQPLQTAPIGATVITAEQIMRSGVSDANEAIRKLGGVAGRTDLSNGREYTLDLRGFGATADQNLVVLVDGIRLSENELLSARLSAIPLDRIERIEIVRGGNSVTWGEGASGGVINVILKSGPQPSSGLVSVAAESFDGRDVLASGVLSLGTATFEGSVRHRKTDGWRDNSDFEQNAGSVGLQWADGGWRVKLRTQRDEQEAQLPGPLTFEQFRDDPRRSFSPDDVIDTSQTLHTANVEYGFGGWTAGLDVARKELHTAARNSFGLTDVHRQSTQWSPRLTYATKVGAADASTTLGATWQRWTYEGTSPWLGEEQGRHRNRAVFWRADVVFPTLTRVSGGVRHEKVVKSAGSATGSYERKDSLRAFDLAANQTLGRGWDVYARLASSYRLPNIDENRLIPSSVDALRPQRSRDKELGVKWAQGPHSATLRWFRQKTVDEIVYVPTAGLFGANDNLDPTLRQGVELEGRWSPTPSWTVAGSWQQISAHYRKGPNAGNDQVLVTPHTATVRVTWQIDGAQVLEAGVQRLSAMRFDGDEANTCARRIPASTLLDARYAWSRSDWTVALSGTNLTDEQVYNYGFSCLTGGIYPEAGRAVKLMVSRRF